MKLVALSTVRILHRKRQILAQENSQLLLNFLCGLLTQVALHRELGHLHHRLNERAQIGSRSKVGIRRLEIGEGGLGGRRGARAQVAVDSWLQSPPSTTTIRPNIQRMTPRATGCDSLLAERACVSVLWMYLVRIRCDHAAHIRG